MEEDGVLCLRIHRLTGLALALLFASASLAVGMTLGAALDRVLVGVRFAGHTVESRGPLTGLTSLEAF